MDEKELNEIYFYTELQVDQALVQYDKIINTLRDAQIKASGLCGNLPGESEAIVQQTVDAMSDLIDDIAMERDSFEEEHSGGIPPYGMG